MSELVEHIKEILLSEQPEILRSQKKTPAEDIQNLLQDERDIRIIALLLIDESKKPFADLFERLHRLVFIIGYSDEVCELIGKIWSIVFEQIDDEDKNRLLNSLVSSNNNIFWVMMNCIQYVLPFLKLETTPLSVFLISMSKRVEGDLAGGKFYKAIEEYGCKIPNNALKLLQEMLKKEPFDGTKLFISSILLGTLRVSPNLDDKNTTLFNSIENELKLSLSTDDRICYYRSFCTSFNKGVTSVEQMKHLLMIMLKGSLSEQTEAFNVAYRCTFGVHEQTEYISFLHFLASRERQSEYSRRSKVLYCRFAMENMW